jgi:hypothetical protein
MALLLADKLLGRSGPAVPNTDGGIKVKDFTPVQ